MASRVLLIDDDRRLHELLSTYLGGNDFDVTSAHDGPSGLSKLAGDAAFDVVLVDIMMPGMDGLEVLRRIRAKWDLPTIMLTAKGDDTDRIVGLELGADDYVPKPFNPRELLARIRAVLRRSGSQQRTEQIKVRELHIDTSSRTVTWVGRSIEVTGLEFDILLALAKRVGRVVSREALLSAAGRGDVIVSDRTIDVHISHIRSKIGDEDAHSLIRTVRGVGYVMTED